MGKRNAHRALAPILAACACACEGNGDARLVRDAGTSADVADIVDAPADAAPAGGTQEGAPWPVFAHDVMRTGRTMSRGPQAARVKWKHAIGSPAGTASPVVAADGTIVIGTLDGHVVAVRPDGTRAWSVATGAAVDGAAAIARDGTLFVGSNDTRLYAITPDGRVRWTATSFASILASPAVGADGTVFFASTISIFALAPDGARKWVSDIPFDNIMSVRGAVALGNDRVYADDGELVVRDLRGYRRSDTWRTAAATTAPVIDRDTVVVGSADGIARTDREGRVIDMFALGSDSPSAISLRADRSLVVTFASGGAATLTADGSARTPILAGNVAGAAAIDADDAAYLGDSDGALIAVEPNGAVRWSLALGGPIRSSPAIGADGTLYIGCDDGNLYAIGG